MLQTDLGDISIDALRNLDSSNLVAPSQVTAVVTCNDIISEPGATGSRFGLS